MAKNRYVDTRFWDDTYIVKLDPTEKLLFLYLLTNPLTNIAGIYEINFRRIAFDTGIDGEMIQNILKRFERDKKIYYIDGYVIICNFPKYQNYEDSPKIQRGIEIILDNIPDRILKSMDTLSIPYVYPLNYTNTNYNTNNNTNTNTNTNTKSDEISSLFEKFYSFYPKKKAKPAALRAFKKLKPNKELLNIILKDIERKKKCDQWQKNNGQFIPHPASYLNQERWNDEEPKSLKDEIYYGY